MFFAELLDLFLYCAQQVGIMLAVGAETLALITYVVATRDKRIDESEERFAHWVHRAVAIGLISIVASGLVITLVHESSGQGTIVFEPVFLFKWLLIAALGGAYFWQRKNRFPQFFIQGIIGGTWYALFLVHILAPLTSWANLLMLYALLLLGFSIMWSIIVVSTRIRTPKPKVAPIPVIKKTEPILPPIVVPKKVVHHVPVTPPLAPKPVVPIVVAKPVAPPAPIIAKPPPPVVPLPVLAKSLLPLVPPPTAVPAANIMPKPQAEPTTIKEEPHSPWLPAIHVMPKNEQDLKSGAHIISYTIKPKTT